MASISGASRRVRPKTMTPSIGGITGGVSNGGTQVVVTATDPAGYSMTIQASTTFGTPGMYGVASSSNYIPIYSPASASVPDFNYVSSTGKATFRRPDWIRQCIDSKKDIFNRHYQKLEHVPLETNPFLPPGHEQFSFF